MDVAIRVTKAASPANILIALSDPIRLSYLQCSMLSVFLCCIFSVFLSCIFSVFLSCIFSVFLSCIFLQTHFYSNIALIPLDCQTFNTNTKYKSLQEQIQMFDITNTCLWCNKYKSVWYQIQICDKTNTSL